MLPLIEHPFGFAQLGNESLLGLVELLFRTLAQARHPGKWSIRMMAWWYGDQIRAAAEVVQQVMKKRAIVGKGQVNALAIVHRAPCPGVVQQQVCVCHQHH